MFRHKDCKIVGDDVYLQRRVDIVPVEVVRPALAEVAGVGEMLFDGLVRRRIAMTALRRLCIKSPLYLIRGILSGKPHPDNCTAFRGIGEVEGEDVG